MTNQIAKLALFAVAGVWISCGAALSASSSDPDWPCVQRKVLHLSTGQMWAGPAITDEELKGWRKHAGVAELAPVLAVRRTSQEEAEALIGAFAQDLGGTKNDTLPLLFAGVFSLIERERSQIISGISRYAHTQTDLSAAIETTQNRLTELNAAEPLDFDTIEELEDEVIWKTRIYKDRAQSLTFVCETPVILERRAFAIARAIMAHLD